MYDLSNIAVLLPVYKNDNANYLSFSVESILKQTYRNIIIFIGIDGPIGNELYRCLQKYENHSQIRIIYFPENRGLAMVLNDLIMMCHKESIDFIMNCGIDYEFRTTVVKSSLDEKDLENIGKTIKGAKRYYLQKFVATKTLNPAFAFETTYSTQEFEHIKSLLLPCVKEVFVR